MVRPWKRSRNWSDRVSNTARLTELHGELRSRSSQTATLVSARRIVLVAAEGMAELEGLDWVRDAAEDEVRAYQERHQLTQEEYRRVIVDRTGRPYWPVTLLDNAPEIAVEKAATYARVRSLIG